MGKQAARKGTRHFPRLAYNTARGLREIIAPVQTMPRAEWERILQEFKGRCVYCDEGSTQVNRGIVPDHVIPVTQFGELVLGNTVPACQACNDARGDKDWRAFLQTRFPAFAEERISRIEAYISQYAYEAVQPEQVLTSEELAAYEQISNDWAKVLATALQLYSAVKARRGLK